jgi:cellulose synthase/poly-beta-1,6-N-acetylglucosamine synthase-like glycosyltransferase
MDYREIYVWVFLLVTVLYLVLIRAFTAGLRQSLRKKSGQKVKYNGFVTVIIAARNEEHTIISTLNDLVQQDYPAASLEVIVADDHSDDDTVGSVSRFSEDYPEFPLILLTAAGAEANARGKKRAIERAVARAKGDILLFTDADTRHGAGWISSMVQGFADPGVQMVLGPVCFNNEHNLLQKIQSLEFLGLMGTTAGSAALGFPVMCNGANLAYRREAFLQCGGFRENLKYASGDDQFMMSTIRKQFGKKSLVFNTDPLSVVTTEPESTLAGFIHQRLRWVSKSRGYRDPAVIFVGLVTYLAHLFLFAGMVAGALFPPVWFISLLFWMVKVLFEFPMVWKMSRFFGKQKMMRYYILAQIFQLIYVPLAGGLGLVVPYRWKGRKG